MGYWKELVALSEDELLLKKGESVLWGLECSGGLQDPRFADFLNGPISGSFFLVELIEVLEGREPVRVGTDGLFDVKAYAFEESFGGMKVFEFVFFHLMCFEELGGTPVVVGDIGRCFGADIDVACDPVTTTLGEVMVDDGGEDSFFGFGEVHEKSFVDYGDGARGEAGHDVIERIGVECVEGLEVERAGEGMG